MDLDVVAMNESLAHFSGVMPFMVRNMLWEYGIENLRPGDMIALNNPFKGGNHATTTVLQAGVRDDRMIGGVAVKAHLMDMGGVTAGGYSTRKRSLFEEGVVISGVPVFRDDEPYTPGFNLYFDNSRLPDNMLADLQALHSACSFAEERLLALAETHGWTPARRDGLHVGLRRQFHARGSAGAAGRRLRRRGRDRLRRVRRRAVRRARGGAQARGRGGGRLLRLDPGGHVVVNCSVFDAANGVYTARKFLCDPHNPNNAGAFRASRRRARGHVHHGAAAGGDDDVLRRRRGRVQRRHEGDPVGGRPAEAGFGGHYGSNMGLLMTGTTDAPPSSGRRDAAGGVGERLAAATQSIPVCSGRDGSGKKLFVAPMLALGGFGRVL